jgi:hypothetical protein
MPHIENRLRKMESSLNPEPPVCIGVATVRHALPREPTKNLATGERVGVDWFRKIGGILWGRERIFNDPADQGPSHQGVHAAPRRGHRVGAPGQGD